MVTKYNEAELKADDYQEEEISLVFRLKQCH